MKSRRAVNRCVALMFSTAFLSIVTLVSATAWGSAMAQSVGPVTTFSSQPAQQTMDRFARFVFSAPGADRFVCMLDNVPLGDCRSPYVLMPRKASDAVLTPGTHSFSVQASAQGVWGHRQLVSWKVASVLDLAKGKQPLVDGLVAIEMTAAPAYQGGAGDASYIQGIARFKCLESHVAYDDPIVYPSMPGHAHLHSFWGNARVDAHTTAESLFTQGESTCQGNKLNRSAYWVPALLAPTYSNQGARTGWKPVLKDADERALARGLFHETYYYSAVVTNVQEITAPPPGLRVIAGTAAATNSAPANNAVLDDPNHIARWYCATRRGAVGRPQAPTSYVPECPISKDASGRDNMLVHYVLRFPSCWDGKNLDSPDHKSHMAYVVFAASGDGAKDRGVVQCPATHPVAIPEVSYHYSFAVTDANADPVTKTSRGWRLASDGYAVDVTADGSFAYGGQSLHGDWFNAWHPEMMQALIDGCLKQRKDCRNGQLGSPDKSGVSFVLGTASPAGPVTYPLLPNTSTSGMPVGMKMNH
jgi:hypothetical protein